MSIGVALVITILRQLLSDALLRLGYSGIVAPLLACPVATAFGRCSHSPVKLERQQSA